MKGSLRCAPLAMLVLLAGCNVLAPADDAAPANLMLDQLPAPVRSSTPRAITLRIETPQARPAYDTTQMAYTLRPHQLAYYGRNQWAETPAQMLQPLLARSLQQSGAFAAVRTNADAQPAFTLHTEVTELLQDYTQEPPLARVALHVRLSAPSGRTLAERDITASEAMQAKNPYAGVVAANAALAHALRDLVQFVEQSLP